MSHHHNHHGLSAPTPNPRIFLPHRSPHLGTTTPTTTNQYNNIKRKREPKPPLPPSLKQKDKVDNSRCSSVDRILDSPACKNARLLGVTGGALTDTEGVERKARSVDDLLEEQITPQQQQLQTQTQTQPTSPVETFAGMETITIDNTAPNNAVAEETSAEFHDRSSRQGSVLSDDSVQSTDSTDSKRNKHFLGKYVKKVKNYLKK